MRVSSFFVFLVACTCVRAQTAERVWLEEDAARYARERSDSTLWDREQLLQDLQYGYDPSELRPALSDLPAPVPAYDYGYVAMRPTTLTIGEVHIEGITLAYAFGPYRPAPEGDTAAYYATHFTLYVLTDRPDRDSATHHVSSRNYPHYLATGTWRTSVGDVDYLNMQLASGESWAVVSQRYFDLRFGTTLLAAPLTEGSLRLLQLADTPGIVNRGSFQDAVTNRRLADFEARLEQNDRVRTFFTQAGVLRID
jgi:hypothetical protein